MASAWWPIKFSEHTASQPCCMPILYAHSMVLVHSQPKGIETGYLYFWYLLLQFHSTKWDVCVLLRKLWLYSLQSNKILIFLGVICELYNVVFCCGQSMQGCMFTWALKLFTHNSKVGYLLTACSTVLLEKLTSSQLVKKFPTFYGTRRFITTFTSAHHLSLSWARSIHSVLSHPTSWRSIVILSSHLCLGLPSGLLPSGFPTKTLYISPLTPIHATCPTHLILHFITQRILGEQYRSLSSSLCSFLHSLVISSLLGPNILLSTLFSNTLSVCSFISISDKVSHPYKTQAKL